jgi:hypothetical protein
VRIRTWVLTTVAGLLICATAATPASACPMCKLANETDARLPMAYMYSILFMLGTPATVLTGFGIGFYRLSRQAARMQQSAGERTVAGANDPAVEATHDTERHPDLSQPPLPGTGLVFP